MSANKA